MGRRRRKVIRILKKKLPRIFTCPNCGKLAIGVELLKNKNQAIIRCGSCNLEEVLEKLPIFHEVDAYCFFIDRFYKAR